jgi:putative transposase
MHHHTPTLTDKDVLRHARSRLHRQLPLQADGYLCTTDDLLHVLLAVAVNCTTIEAVCADLLGTPDPETIRRYLNSQLRVEDLPALEGHLNAALADAIPAHVWTHARDVAIDFHDRPYYGKTSQDEGLWVRGQAKDGTTRFSRIATAYLMLDGMRITLALRFVVPEDDTVAVLEHLLGCLEMLNLRLKRLVLDKGFSGTAVLTYLTARQQPALIACPLRGKKAGTRDLCQGKSSYRTSYTFNKDRAEAFTAEVAVCRTVTSSRRTHRMERHVTWLLFILLNLEMEPKRVRREYRKRFGVESSSRCAGQVRGWTTSRNAAYRFVLMGLSFIVLNEWLVLRWCFTQVRQRGRRLLATKRFALSRFVAFVRRALEAHYGVVHEIVASAVPRL